VNFPSDIQDSAVDAYIGESCQNKACGDNNKELHFTFIKQLHIVIGLFSQCLKMATLHLHQ